MTGHALNVEAGGLELDRLAALAMGFKIRTTAGYAGGPVTGSFSKFGAWVFLEDDELVLSMYQAGDTYWSPTTDSNDALRLQTALDPGFGGDVSYGYVTRGGMTTVAIYSGTSTIARESGTTYPEALTRALLAVAGREG